MATLQDLPIDLKILVLEYTDIDTLLSLILASRQYNDAFKCYRDKLIDLTWANELKKYERESKFLETFEVPLRFQWGKAEEIESILDQYVQYGNLMAEGVHSGYEYRGYSCDENDCYDYLFQKGQHIALHKAFRRLCKLFVADEMRPRLDVTYRTDSDRKAEIEEQSMHASASEKERIILALYRLEIAQRFHAVRTSDIGADEYPSEELTLKLFNVWGFWDFMAVNVVKDYFFDKLLPFAKAAHPKETSFAGSDIGLCRSNRLSEFAPSLFSFIMLYTFPNDFLDSKEQGVDVEDMIHAIQHKSTRACLDKLGDIRAYYWSYRGNRNFDHTEPNPLFSKAFMKYLDGELWYPNQYDENLWPDTPAMRICKPGHVPFPVEERTGLKSWTRPFKERRLDEIDIKACLWDDWRLDSWGYVFPKFEAWENIERDHPGQRVTFSFERPAILQQSETSDWKVYERFGYGELDNLKIEEKPDDEDDSDREDANEDINED